jgi:GMP synthase (glutamine-hydrolysing)
MRPPVLIVLHGELSTPGRVAIQLRNRDIPLDVRRPRFGDDLPKTLADHTGVVIFGGPQSANDDDEIVKREIDWIGVALKEKKPYLGICLGAQMLAKHLGARVYKHADGHAEVGYYPIRPTADGRAVCKDWPDHVYQWHREGFDLPNKAVMLAEGDSFPVQAFSYGGTAYALQFHMDVTHATMCRWTTRGHERMTLPNAKPRESHFEGRLMHDPACRTWLSEFIDHWLEAPEPAKGIKGKAPAKKAAPKISPVKPAHANGSGQRRTVSRFSTR